MRENSSTAEGDALADYPDIYADGFSVSVNPAGVTITLTLSDPTLEPGPSQPPVHIAVLLRMSAFLAEDLAQIITNAVAQAKAGGTQQISQTKH